jgi:hypothetical protein
VTNTLKKFELGTWRKIPDGNLDLAISSAEGSEYSGPINSGEFINQYVNADCYTELSHSFVTIIQMFRIRLRYLDFDII